MFNACIEDISVKNYKFCSFPLKIMEYEKKLCFWRPMYQLNISVIINNTFK